MLDLPFLRDAHPYYVAGEEVPANSDLAVVEKATGGELARVALGRKDVLDAAILRADEARDACARLPAHARRAALAHVRARIEEHADGLARLITRESGKPLANARAEVGRAVSTFRLAEEACGDPRGEWLALDGDPAGEGYDGLVRRFPVGPVACITPFNFPLNLVAHKVAPAIAAGCPFVLKPADRTPLSALALGAFLAETDLPRGAWSVVPLKVRDADALVDDARLRALSFTGSAAVGWELAARAARKRVLLELGGNAACVVDEGTDLDDCVERLVKGIFGTSGQSCISVQRVFAHRSLYDALRERLLERTRGLKFGDPLEEDTDVGPLIDEAAARRLETWVREARDAGATVLAGGGRDGAWFEPTLLEGVDPRVRLACEEAFGPLALLEPFDELSQALAAADASRFGLQLGLFTRDLDRALDAFESVEVGALVVDDVPTTRIDAMPYGGVKESGRGREGVRWAVEELSEPRLLLVRRRR